MNNEDFEEFKMQLMSYGAFVTLEDRKPIAIGFISKKYNVWRYIDNEAYMKIISNYLLKRKLRVKLVEKGIKEKVRKI